MAFVSIGTGFRSNEARDSLDLSPAICVALLEMVESRAEASSDRGASKWVPINQTSSGGQIQLEFVKFGRLMRWKWLVI